jgi:hypothetical protein
VAFDGFGDVVDLVVPGGVSERAISSLSGMVMMSFSMALTTQSNQVVQFVASECTAKADVVNFEFGCASAILASPTISFENLSAKGVSTDLVPASLSDAVAEVNSRAGFGKLPFEKLIKGLQIVDPPVLPGPRLTKIATEFNEARIALPLGSLFPGQNLIDLGENKHGVAMIEFRGHGRVSVTPQTG